MVLVPTVQMSVVASMVVRMLQRVLVAGVMAVGSCVLYVMCWICVCVVLCVGCVGGRCVGGQC